jgi:NAD(P)-dependent dehydrogenase (short-subunit alcohol dehydrogenase family)
MTAKRSWSLDGKVALVTGGSTGIGLEITRQFRQRGARVVILARDARRGAEAVEALGLEAVAYVSGDVSDPATARAAVAFTERHFGPLNVLVNNAAVDHDEPLLTVEPETSLAVFRTNFHGAFWMLQAAARAMTGRGGAIVNISSRLASVGVSGMSLYGATKGALTALTRGAAIDLAPERIRVNAVAPGFTETAMLRAWLDEHEDAGEARAQAVSSIPLGRLGSASDVAAVVAFLAADEAGFITGVSVPVDGGYTAQ